MTDAELNRDKTELTNSVTELKSKVTELEKQIDQLSNDNHVLKTAFITQKEQIEKYKIEKEYYDNLCHKKIIECDDLRKGIKQFQSDNERFIKKIEELEEENAKLKEQIKKMRNCGNCNGIINGIRQEKCHFCMRSKLLSEWEPAE